MPRGTGYVTKVTHKGNDGVDYTVFADSIDAVNNWRKAPDSTPLAQVVSGFRIMSSTQGNQGMLGEPSKQQLETEFGVTGDEAIKKILMNGKVQEQKVCRP